MADFSHTALPDCILIAKRFERAAAFSPTEEAVFAMMTPAIQGMIVNAQSFIDQVDSDSTSTVMQASAQNSISGSETETTNLRSMDKAGEGDPGLYTSNVIDEVEDNTEEAKSDVLSDWIASCFPCDFRLQTTGELTLKLLASPFEGIGAWLTQWKEWLMSWWSQITDLINLFNGNNNMMDICALSNFMSETICVPDLNRMLSMLMALMNRMSFEFGGLMEFMVSLIGPILSPFLSGIVNQIQKYILMIVKPIECIIEAIQNMLSKLDYNVFFQQVDSLEKSEPVKKRMADPRDPIKVPYMDAYIPRRDYVDGEGYAESNIVFDTSRNLWNKGVGHLQDWARQEREEDEAKVADAQKELEQIRKAGQNVDAANAEALEKQKEKERAAEDKLRRAEEERDLGKIGMINAEITHTVQNIKSAFMNMMSFLREGVQVIEGFFRDIFEEWQKLMGEYIGGTGGFIGELIKKLYLVQLIALIFSIISALQRGCDQVDPVEMMKQTISEESNLTVFTDENGDLRIQEEDFEETMEAMVRAIGQEPYRPDVVATREADKGIAPSELTARQKLKSLIEFTGDPVLDTEIARATEALTTPVDLAFKCPLQTSVASAEKVNQWIKELNTE